MSREDVEVVRRLFAAVDAEDWEAALGSFAPEVEWSPLEGNFRGLQGVIEALVEWLEPWEEHTIEAEEVAEVGHRVLAVVHLTGRGAGSGLEIDQRFFQIYAVRDGRIVRMTEFGTRAEALEAAASP